MVPVQYVTEKLWSRLKMNVIPVVLGQVSFVKSGATVQRYGEDLYLR